MGRGSGQFGTGRTLISGRELLWTSYWNMLLQNKAGVRLPGFWALQPGFELPYEQEQISREGLPGHHDSMIHFSFSISQECEAQFLWTSMLVYLFSISGYSKHCYTFIVFEKGIRRLRKCWELWYKHNSNVPCLIRIPCVPYHCGLKDPIKIGITSIKYWFKMHTPVDLPIPLLWVYPADTVTHVGNDIWTSVFIRAFS